MNNGNAPSAWTVINEYSKTIIAVAAGFLALTVTFCGQLLHPFSRGYPLWSLLACWILLVLVIASSLLSAAFLSNYLRNKGNPNLCIFFCNVAFFALFLAALFFLIFAISAVRIKNRLTGPSEAVTKSLSFVERNDPLKSVDWWLTSLEWNETKKQWDLTFQSETPAKAGTISRVTSLSFDSAKKEIVNYKGP